MNIVVDENIPSMTVEALRTSGHVVTDLRGTPEQGMDDAALWDKAQQEKALLVTTDKGFTEHRSEAHFGLLIVRLHQPNRHKIHARVMKAVSQYTGDEWTNLTIVMRDTVQSAFRWTEP